MNPQQLERYERHLALPEIGEAGQEKLLASSVLVVGAGGLGSPASMYLAAAGVGRIGLVDGDRVDRSNLQRQLLHSDAGLGELKTRSGRETLLRVNPDVRVDEHPLRLNADNARLIVAGYDLVVNGCDNFPTRYLLNDICVWLAKPLVDASILRFEAQATVYLPGQGCYRCLFPAPPPPGLVPSCAEGGILGALAGTLGSLQAVEAVKVLLGVGRPLSDRLLLYDALGGEWRSLRRKRDPNCPVCGDSPSLTEPVDYEQFCGLKEESMVKEVQPNEASALVSQDSSIQFVDVREPHEWAKVHAVGVNLIPLGDLPERVEELDKSRPVLCICARGGRSMKACEFLMSAGFSDVTNVAEGTTGWVEAGLPTESGA